MKFSLLLLPLVSGLTIDASKYSPDPPPEIVPVASQIQFPYTERFSRAFSKELIECMANMEISDENLNNYDLQNDPVNSQCYFIQSVLEKCQQFESQDGNFWSLQATKQDLHCGDIINNSRLSSLN